MGEGHGDLMATLQLVRGDIERAEKGLYRRLDQITARQDIQNGRVNKHEAQFAAVAVVHETHGDRLQRLETQVGTAAEAIARVDGRTSYSSGFRLTAKQRAALWTGLMTGGGVVVELLHQLSAWLQRVPPGVRP
jgi:hypothetical protein